MLQDATPDDVESEPGKLSAECYRAAHCADALFFS